MKNFHYKITPITLPIILFAGTIAGGTLLLHSRSSLAVASISWLDALFTATSAVCVTGLVTLDTGTTFSLFGQSTILFLIQLGGIGIMTYTALIYYLIRQRVALNDRFVIGQGLQHDRSRPFGKLLVKIVLWTVIIEIIGALLLNAAAPRDFTFFTALFHSVSAFCNAGFSLYQDSLSHWHGDWGVNLVVMLLIVAGGLGFAVVVELNGCLAVFVKRCRPGFIKGSGTLEKSRLRLSWYSKIILFTTFFLIVGGGVGISFFEYCVAPPGTRLVAYPVDRFFSVCDLPHCRFQYHRPEYYDQCLTLSYDYSDVYRRGLGFLRRRPQSGDLQGFDRFSGGSAQRSFAGCNRPFCG